RSGRLWLSQGGYAVTKGGLPRGGIVEYETDRVAPQTVILSVPPAISGSRLLTIPFDVGYGEQDNFEFSYYFGDSIGLGSPSSWSPWTTARFWSNAGIPDGRHLFAVRARDAARNVDPSPAVVSFQVDA